MILPLILSTPKKCGWMELQVFGSEVSTLLSNTSWVTGSGFTESTPNPECFLSNTDGWISLGSDVLILLRNFNTT